MEDEELPLEEVDMASVTTSDANLDPCNYEYLDTASSQNLGNSHIKKRKVMAAAPIIPRARAYPDDFGGPWVVYFRPIDKPLHIMRIQQDLNQRFPAVTLIHKTGPNRLRVEVSDRKQANEIVKCELFTRQYNVYIPARDVEIDGVINEGSLKPEDLLNGGIGCFKNPAIKPVPILGCTELVSASNTGESTTYHPSGSLRVTFAGSALPDYVLIGKIRLPVRLFVYRVMTCLNCKQFGHTATHCGSKAKCGKCGESHADDLCSKTAVKCVYCREDLHALSACPLYKMRGEQLKMSQKARSQHSYAEMVKKSNTTISPNPFAILSDCIDEDEADEGLSATPIDCAQKRKNTAPLSPLRPHKGRRTSPVRKQNTRGSSETAIANVSSPNYAMEFPALPGTSTTSDVPKPASSSSNVNTPPKQPNPQQEPSPLESGMFPFETVVEWILDAFELPQHLRSFIVPLLPKLKGFVQKLCVKLPILSVFISFDG